MARSKTNMTGITIAPFLCRYLFTTISFLFATILIGATLTTTPTPILANTEHPANPEEQQQQQQQQQHHHQQQQLNFGSSKNESNGVTDDEPGINTDPFKINNNSNNAYKQTDLSEVSNTDHNFENEEDIRYNTTETDYSAYYRLYRDLLDPNRYDPLIRPVYNRSEQITVTLGLKVFQLLTIDNVGQKMVTHCFLDVIWSDQFVHEFVDAIRIPNTFGDEIPYADGARYEGVQLLTWDPKDYGGIHKIEPKITTIWKPDISLYNSLDAWFAEIGDGNQLRPSVDHYGIVYWGYGSLMSTSCALDMDKYPFDVQTCDIEILTMNILKEVDFNVLSVDASHLRKNYEWSLIGSMTRNGVLTTNGVQLPWAKFILKLKRKPIFILIVDILPTIALSLLNCFVFLVPIDSGEKISFGISVLLALAVCLSYTSNKLPPANEGVPAVILYLSCLFGNAILSVILTILNVRLQWHMTKDTSSSTDTDAKTSTRTPNHAHVNSNNNSNNTNKEEGNNGMNKEATPPSSALYTHDDDATMTNYYSGAYGSQTKMLRLILKHAEALGFFLVTGFWGGITVWYFVYVSS